MHACAGASASAERVRRQAAEMAAGLLAELAAENGLAQEQHGRIIADLKKQV